MVFELAIPSTWSVGLDLVGGHHEGALGAVGGLVGGQELLQLEVQPGGRHLHTAGGAGNKRTRWTLKPCTTETHHIYIGNYGEWSLAAALPLVPQQVLEVQGGQEGRQG